jgi:predicted nuclease of predicted toxin-antitoxin system
MKLLIDMNLSPDWVQFLAQHGIDALHWSTIGDPRASDDLIMDWTWASNYIVLTHDLDFGTILAKTKARGPSVVQLRSQDVLPSAIGNVVVGLLTQFDGELERGAIVVADPRRSRVRFLPIG